MRTGFFHSQNYLPLPNELAVGPLHASSMDGVSKVTLNGAHFGWYVDDEASDQEKFIRDLASDGVIFAGVPLGDPARHFPGAISLLQYYPVGYPPPWPELPKAEGYILQGSFHWPNALPPDFNERRKMYHMALRHQPRFILWYRWGSGSGPILRKMMQQA